jgi:hypothetical protein
MPYTYTAPRQGQAVRTHTYLQAHTYIPTRMCTRSADLAGHGHDAADVEAGGLGIQGQHIAVALILALGGARLGKVGQGSGQRQHVAWRYIVPGADAAAAPKGGAERV